MAMRYLGPRFDIHTGGIDNIFPHHEDEIAQTAAITGEVPARHWVHGEFLLMDGRKMAKSAGNFLRVTELADRGLDPLAFRYLALTARYSRKLEYSDRSLGAAAAALGSLRAGLRAPRAGRRRTGRGPLPHASGPAGPAIGRMASRAGSPGTAPSPAAGRRRRAEGPRDVAGGARCRPPGAPSTIGSWLPSTTTWTCLPRWPSCARSSARRSRTTSGAGSSSMPTGSSGSTSIGSGKRILTTADGGRHPGRGCDAARRARRGTRGAGFRARRRAAR